MEALHHQNLEQLDAEITAELDVLEGHHQVHKLKDSRLCLAGLGADHIQKHGPILSEVVVDDGPQLDEAQIAPLLVTVEVLLELGGQSQT